MCFVLQPIRKACTILISSHLKNWARYFTPTPNPACKKKGMQNWSMRLIRPGWETTSIIVCCSWEHRNLLEMNSVVDALIIIFWANIYENASGQMILMVLLMFGLCLGKLTDLNSKYRELIKVTSSLLSVMERYLRFDFKNCIASTSRRAFWSHSFDVIRYVNIKIVQVHEFSWCFGTSCNFFIVLPTWLKIIRTFYRMYFLRFPIL